MNQQGGIEIMGILSGIMHDHGFCGDLPIGIKIYTDKRVTLNQSSTLNV